MDPRNYSPVGTEDGETSSDEFLIEKAQLHRPGSKASWTRVAIIAIIAAIFQTVLLAGVFTLGRTFENAVSNGPDHAIVLDRDLAVNDADSFLLSPEISELHTVLFEGDFMINTSYRYPTPKDVQEIAWGALLDQGPTSISAEEAKAYNKSSIVLEDGRHMVILDVFHQLHCINYLRMVLHIEDYPEEQKVPVRVRTIHFDHCLDILRQAVMCTSDTTIIPFEEVISRDGDLIANPVFTAKHQCRNFDKLLAWSYEKKVPFPDKYVVKHGFHEEHA